MQWLRPSLSLDILTEVKSYLCVVSFDPNTMDVSISYHNPGLNFQNNFPAILPDHQAICQGGGDQM